MDQATLEMVLRAREELAGLDKTIAKTKAARTQFIRFQRTIKRYSRKIRMALKKMVASFRRLQAALTKLRNVALKAFTAIVALNGIPIALYSRFEREMANVNTLMNKSREELVKYEDAVMDLAQESGKSTKKLANGLYDVVSAGVEASNSIAVLEKATKASVAGQTDVATAVKAGVSTMNAMGMAVQDLSKIYDVQFSTVKEGIITYEELANSIQNVLPSAQRVNASIEDVYGSLSFLTKNSISAERATTAIARSMDLMAKKADAFKQIGVGVYNSQGQFREYSNIVQDLATQLQGLTERQQELRLQDIGLTERAAKAIIPMISNIEKYKDVLKEVSKSEGAMAQAHEVATNNIMFNFNRVKQTAITTAMELGRSYRGEIIDALNNFRGLIKSIGQFIKENKEAIKSVSIFALKVSAMITVVSGLGAALFALMTPIGAVAGGIALLASAWYVNLYDIQGYWNDTLKPILTNIKDWTIEKIEVAWEHIQSEEFQNKIDKIKKKLKDVKNYIVKDFQNWGKDIEDEGLIMGSLLQYSETRLDMLDKAGDKLVEFRKKVEKAEDQARKDSTSVDMKKIYEESFNGQEMPVSLEIGINFAKSFWQSIKNGFEMIRIGKAMIDWLLDKTIEGFKKVGASIAGQIAQGIKNYFDGVSLTDMILNPEVKEKAREYRTGGKTHDSQKYIDEVLNNYHGGIVPGGYSNKDNMLSMVASGEAIVPNYVVREGPQGVLEWFKDQGVPGFYDGKSPYGGSAALFNNNIVDSRLLRDNSSGYQSNSLDYFSTNLETMLKSNVEVLRELNNEGIVSDVELNLAQLEEAGLGDNKILRELAKNTNANFSNVLSLFNGFKESQEQFKEVIEDIKNGDFQDALNKLTDNNNSTEEQTKVLKNGFSNLVSQMSSFANNIQQLTGSEGWGAAAGVMDSVGSFKGSLDKFNSAEGMMGSLTAGFGMTNAVLGGVSAIKSYNEQQNKELLQEYQNSVKLDQEQLDSLKQVESNTRETAKNIVKAVSENPTTENIQIAGQNLEKQINMLEEARPDFGEVRITGIDQDKWWHGEKRVLDQLSPFRAAEKAGMDLSEFDLTKQFEKMRTGRDSTREIFAGYKESLNDLPLSKLEDFEKKFDDLTEKDMKEIASQGIDKEFQTNLGTIQEQIESYIDTLTELKETRKELTYSSRMESFEGINYLDKEEAIKQYKEQLIETYEAAGYTDKEIDEMSGKIKDIAKDMAETTNSEVTAMKNVRDGFKQAFADGANMIESFAQGLESYFNKLKNNIAGMVYDVELSSLNEDFENLFSNISEKLANLGEKESPIEKIKEYFSDDTIISSEKIADFEVLDYDPRTQLYELSTGSPLDSIFEDMKELEDQQQNMDTIVDVIRDKAKEAGISQEIIGNMLPSTEASEKAKEIADNIRNAVSDALKNAFDEVGNFNFLDMTKSLGQSVYDSVKQSMIDAFKDSRVYEQKLKQFFQESQFKEDIKGMSMREIGQYMEGQLKQLNQDLRREGLDRVASQVQTEVSSNETSSNTDYYSGTDTSGEGGNITNNHYHFSPEIENSYGSTKEELFEEFLKFKKQLEKEQA